MAGMSEKAKMRNEFKDVVLEFAVHGIAMGRGEYDKAYGEEANICHQECMVQNPAYKDAFNKFAAIKHKIDDSDFHQKMDMIDQEESDIKANIQGLLLIAKHVPDMLKMYVYEHKMWKISKPILERHLVLEMR